MHTQLDTDFRRFQQTRAPEALAAVFDAAAPRLLLVAMHLCRDSAAAEDLVQTVFLAAIKDADQWDASRPVLPWLLGILEHRAQDRQNRAHVTRERGSRALTAVGSLIADPTPGPVSAAADAELRSQVATAIEGVPKQYREVLALRLVHGLRAIDIAHAQGVSPETIRTRLRRGLQMLRSSLPRGVATSAMLTLLATECLRASNGLPVIRGHILQTLTGPATAIASTVAMKWLWSVGIGAAVLVGALFALTPPDPLAPPIDHAPDKVEVAAGALASTRQANHNAPARELVTANATSASGTRRATTTVLRGRVVAAAGSVPLADATVSMRTYTGAGRGPTPADWVDPQPVVTDSRGVFEFAFVPPPSLYFEFRVSATGFVTDFLHYESLRQGIEVNVGDIALDAGTPVQLRVLVGEQPWQGLEVYASRSENGDLPAGMRGHPDTNANGTSDFGTCAAGTYYFEVRTHLAGPKTGTFTVPLQGSTFVHTVQLQLPDPELSVGGTVVDQYAKPVAGLELHIPTPGDWTYVTATTRADGTFFFGKSLPPEGEQQWHFELPRSRTDLVWIEDGGKFAWGKNDLQLMVRRRATASLRLEVVDAQTGEAIESFGARCIPDPWRKVGGSVNFQPVPCAPHAGGIQVFGELRPAPYRVSVYAPQPYAEATWLEAELREGQTTTLRVELASPAPMDIEIVAEGTLEPLAGVQVALCRVVPEGKLDAVDPADYRNALKRHGTGWFSTGTNILVLDRALTDDAGRVQLHAAAGAPAMAIFVTAPHCQDKLIRSIDLPQSGTTRRIAVEPAAQLQGLLKPLAFVQRFGPSPEDLAEAAELEKVQLPEPGRFTSDYPEIELRAVGSTGAAFQTYTDAAGRFELASVPPGTYEVWVSFTVSYGARSSSSRDVGPLTTVEIRPGDRSLQVEVDASSMVPGRASGRFFVDGQPWPGGVGLARIRTTAAAKFTASTSTTSPQGVRTTPWLIPGTYYPFAKVEVRPNIERAIYGLEPIHVAPGQQVEFTAALQRRRVVVTLLDRDGHPLAGRRVVPKSLDHPQMAFEWRYGELTDANGSVTFDPAPLGRLRIMAFSPSQNPGRREVEPEVLLGHLHATGASLSAIWPQ